MDSKDKCIKDAYGEHFDLYKDVIDKDGWFIINDTRELNKFNISISSFWQQSGYNPFKRGADSHIQEIKIRPRSLEGIENNKGWILFSDQEPEDLKYITFLYGKLNLIGYYDAKCSAFRHLDLEYSTLDIIHWKPINTTESLPVY